MKIPTVLIYATFCIYANLTLAHEEKNHQIFEKYAYGEMKNLIIHETPRPIPKINVVSSGGLPKVLNLAPYNVVLINFWATWCPPCLEEMPSLNKLVDSIDSRKFSVIIIASGRQSEEKINTFLEKNNIDKLYSFRDPKGKAAAKLGIFGLPSTIIIDQNSNEIARLIGGANWNSNPSIDFIKSILNDHN